jgi:hypothetical protein
VCVYVCREGEEGREANEEVREGVKERACVQREREGRKEGKQGGWEGVCVCMCRARERERERDKVERGIGVRESVCKRESV